MVGQRRVDGKGTGASMPLETITDMHTHILPEMDDGSKSVDMSVAMLRKMAEMGITTVCATSHYYADQNDTATYCVRRSKALEALHGILESDSSLPRIRPAAEVAYFRNMEEHHLERLCIEGTRTLMLEMPFTEWTDQQVETVTTLSLDQHYQVVLVHPERFCFSKGNRQKLEQMVELPIGLQVNAGSLISWSTRRLALELLRLTDTPLRGSDSHNLTSRAPNLKGGRDVIRRKLGEGFLARMDENAARLTAQG